jgi:hypothetical protein
MGVKIILNVGIEKILNFRNTNRIITSAKKIIKIMIIFST